MAQVHPSYRVMAQSEIKKWTDSIEDMLSPYTSEGIEEKLEESMDIIEERSLELVPEDTRATRDSWFREIEKSGNEVIARFGYDKEGRLDYVPLIHEVFPGLEGGTWQKEGASTHFLSKPIQENELKIARILSRGG